MRCGRFAPSPTGPLHFGSLIAALASHLDARCQGYKWVVRMEDIDTPRNIPGAADNILHTLEALGFNWDGPVLWQCTRLPAYAAALETLIKSGDSYPCTCSRKEIADSISRPAIDGGLAYPGTCRNGLAAERIPRAWRLRVDQREISFIDRLQGRITQQLERDVGDFVLKRSDGLFAYQLAVVVDDAEQGITDIVRGADLLSSTPRQLWLQHCLGLPTPNYLHLPIASNRAGEKLSKQTLAPALDPQQGAALLCQALRFLGQIVPAELDRAGIDDVWQWAYVHWDNARIPQTRSILVID